MQQPSPRRTIPLALFAAGAVPATASAHGISGAATDTSTLGYVPLGIEHMLLGWDHLLFVLAIVLLAGSPRRAAKLISLFVAGHSLTLLLATVNEWRVSPTAVDVVVALSIVFVAVIGLRGRPRDFLPISLAIFGFGLVHGLGLSTRLQDLGIPDAGLVGKILAFNVGIEIGQFAAVAAMVGVIWLAARMKRWPQVRQGAFAALTAVGLVAAAALSFPGDEPRPQVVAGATETCRVVEERDPGTFAGGHPDKKFFGPDERAPAEDLGHVIADGFVVVRYRPDLPAAQVAELRDWITGLDKALVGASDPEQAQPVTAVTTQRAMRCGDFDGTALRRFADEWFATLRAN
jgi:hypothetical protein